MPNPSGDVADSDSSPAGVENSNKQKQFEKCTISGNNYTHHQYLMHKHKQKHKHKHTQKEPNPIPPVDMFEQIQLGDQIQDLTEAMIMFKRLFMNNMTKCKNYNDLLKV